MIRIKSTGLWVLAWLCAGAFCLQSSIAQEEPPTFNPFRGLRQFSEVNSYGSDTIDLVHLGLVVKQELSPAFRANDLPYQVVAYYHGSGWSRKRFPTQYPTIYTKYSWFTPSTLWGPLGAGWNVHMGKLLSSGLAEPTSYEGRAIQRGFTADCTTVPLCDQYGQVRWVWNDILTPEGAQHPASNGYCGPIRSFATDFSWIQIEQTNDSVCQGVLSWRAPDGTRSEVDARRLVNRITDLSGNRIEIEYHDLTSMSLVRDCTTNPDWCKYDVQLQDVEWTWQRGDSPTHEVMAPLKAIRDSNGRRIDFILTDTAIGGKYRIGEIRSVAPNGQVATYRLTYEERNVSTPLDSAPPEFWEEAPPEFPCGGGYGCVPLVVEIGLA